MRPQSIVFLISNSHKAILFVTWTQNGWVMLCCLRLSNIHVALCCLIGLVDGIALGAQSRRGGAGLEVLAQGRGEERAEDDVGTTEYFTLAARKSW